MTFGAIVFLILIVGAYMALRELATAQLHKVTTTPSVTFLPPASSIPTPTGFVLCSGSGTGASTSLTLPTYNFCGR